MHSKNRHIDIFITLKEVNIKNGTVVTNYNNKSQLCLKAEDTMLSFTFENNLFSIFSLAKIIVLQIIKIEKTYLLLVKTQI